jgi:alkaline phosphatase D
VWGRSSAIGLHGRKARCRFEGLLKHGVRSALEYVSSGDLQKARTLSNPNLSPHVSFVDMAGHGYAVVRVTSDILEIEFACIPRSLERSDRPDGGPLRYRTWHRAPLWRKGERPSLELEVLDGTSMHPKRLG